MADREKYPSEAAERFQVRLPEGMRNRIKKAAEENGRSMNAEIVQRLDESFSEPLILPPDLMLRIEKLAREHGTLPRSLIIGALETMFPDAMTLGEFIDEWAIPAARAETEDERDEIISRSKLYSGGYYILKERDEDGARTLNIVNVHNFASKSLARIPIEEVYLVRPKQSADDKEQIDFGPRTKGEQLAKLPPKDND